MIETNRESGQSPSETGTINLRRAVAPYFFFKIYAIEIGHQFRVRGIIGIGQDYMSSEYEQVPTSSFGENLV